MTNQERVDLDRLRGVTRLFPVFLGLRLLPIGVWFLLIPLLRPFEDAVLAALLALAVAATWPIHLWYRRQYGVVEPTRLGLGRIWPMAVGLVLAIVVLESGASLLGGTGGMVLLLVLILFAIGVLFALPRMFGSGTGAVAIVIAIAVVGGAAMLMAARDPLGFNALGAIFSVALGATLCAAGWIEHRVLAVALKRPEADEDV